MLRNKAKPNISSKQVLTLQLGEEKTFNLFWLDSNPWEHIGRATRPRDVA